MDVPTTAAASPAPAFEPTGPELADPAPPAFGQLSSPADDRGWHFMKPIGAIAATLAMSLLVVGCGDRTVEVVDRQQQVAEKGAEVMPFDLEATTHIFKRTDVGLVQVVVADSPADEDQVPLIRTHLQQEARRFNAGDFGDPQAIHGADMPGVQELARGADLLDIRYRPVPAGAKIVFRTASPALVTALHAWASAQVEDHGRHAQHG